MSSEFVEFPEAPAKRATLFRFLSTALTFGAVLTMAAWLLRDDGTADTAVTPNAVRPSEVPKSAGITGHEKGGLAVLFDDLGMGRRRLPPPITVYLVANEEQRLAAEHGLEDDAIVLVGWTPTEPATADTFVRELLTNLEPGREVRVVDLRATWVGSSAGVRHP
jgi:hypothetical protein